MDLQKSLLIDPSFSKKSLLSFRVTKYMTLFLFVGIIVIMTLLMMFNPLKRFELITYDFRFRLRGNGVTSTDLAFIEVAEDSINKIGRWPWPRKWHATLISSLKGFNPEAISLDVLFLDPSDPEDDKALEDAMRGAQNVYLPLDFETKTVEQVNQQKDLVSKGFSIVYPIQQFQENAKGMGHIWINPDSDGVIRRIPLYVLYDGVLQPYLPFKIVLDHLDVKASDIEILPGKHVFIKKSSIGPITIPIDKNYQTPINWVGRWEETFNHYSYSDVLKSYQLMQQGEAPLIDLNVFKDKICLVSLTAVGLYDSKPIPLQPVFPMVGVHANLIANVLNKSFVHIAPAFITLLFIILFTLIIGTIVPHVTPLQGLVISLLLLCGYLGGAFFVFHQYAYVVNIIYPSLTILFSYIVFVIYRYILQETTRKKEIRDLVESLIASSIKSIDARDPSTAGHSQRVAYYSVSLARGINRTKVGAFAKTRFSKDQISEILYAGWLHDIGKIGVRENILTKSTRLTKEQINLIETRFNLIKSCCDMEIQKYTSEEETLTPETRKNLENYAQIKVELASYLDLVKNVNIAHYLNEERMRVLLQLAEKKFTAPDGQIIEYLTAKELENLAVEKGNLTDDERKQMQTHARHTYEILREIAFPKELKNVSKYASFHHEHLDGKGYPFGKKADEIPMQARIIAVADVFDALTSADRYYKKAFPVDVALEILTEEVQNNYLDKDVVEIFIRDKLYEVD